MAKILIKIKIRNGYIFFPNQESVVLPEPMRNQLIKLIYTRTGNLKATGRAFGISAYHIKKILTEEGVLTGRNRTRLYLAEAGQVRLASRFGGPE